MARVTIEELETAKEWLLVNEGDEDGEMAACRKVVAWIDAEIEQRGVRAAARAAGVSVAMARKALATRSTPN